VPPGVEVPAFRTENKTPGRLMKKFCGALRKGAALSPAGRRGDRPNIFNNLVVGASNAAGLKPRPSEALDSLSHQPARFLSRSCGVKMTAHPGFFQCLFIRQFALSLWPGVDAARLAPQLPKAECGGCQEGGHAPVAVARILYTRRFRPRGKVL
jgi:hypothetical protein